MKTAARVLALEQRQLRQGRAQIRSTGHMFISAGWSDLEIIAALQWCGAPACIGKNPVARAYCMP